MRNCIKIPQHFLTYCKLYWINSEAVLLQYGDEPKAFILFLSWGIFDSIAYCINETNVVLQDVGTL